MHVKRLKIYEAMILKHDRHEAAAADADAEASAALQDIERAEQQQVIESQQYMYEAERVMHETKLELE